MAGSARSALSRLAFVLSTLFVVAACEQCEEPDLNAIPVPEDQIDLFTQKQAAQVDILWVVDNSGSMAAEQFKIADRFSEFFRNLIQSQVDYHIGVITTDPAEDGALRAYDGPSVTGCDGCRFITKDVPCANPAVVITDDMTEQQIESTLQQECQAQLVFRNLVTVGIDGTPFEEGFPQAARALGAQTLGPDGFPTGEIPPENEGFLRREASLYIVFVSDEDEGAKQDGSPVRYYQRLFESLKGAGNENIVSVSAITGWPTEDGVPGLGDVCGILQTTFDNNAANDHTEAAEVRELMTSGTGCVDQTGEEGDPNSYAETGGRYIELACRTGGVVTNMCEADYTTALDQLGANAAGLLRKFVISRADEMDKGSDCVLFTDDDNFLDCDGDGDFTVNPDDPADFDDSLCVKARPIGSAEGSEALIKRGGVSGWEWEDSTRSVRFNGGFVPAPGSEITITYKLRQPGSPPCQ